MTAATRTATAYDYDIRGDLVGASPPWWVFLLLGIAWIFVGMLVLQFDLESITAISLLFGFIAIAAGITEFVAVFTMPGWKWLHAIIGLLFVAAGVWAIVYPGQTFGTLALLVGWFLLVKGVFDVVASLMSRDLDLWWMGLIAGILEIAIAVWAVGYPGRSAHLLVLWVGLGAIVRGIVDIVLAFQIRSVNKEGWT